MKDKNGKRLRVDDKVEITLYSYYEHFVLVLAE